MPGRNDPCSCGSGKKYKKCCLIEEKNTQIRPLKPDPEECNSESNDYDSSLSNNYTPDKYSDSNGILSNTRPEHPDLPVLGAEQNAIVQKWFDDLYGHGEKPDPDNLIVQLRSFMNEYPGLFVYLFQEDSVLFELEDSLYRKKEYYKYIDLLKEIRQKHPDAYQRAFTYYDYSLFIDAVATGNSELILSSFDYFRKFPDLEIYEYAKFIRFLAWTGLEKELIEYLKIAGRNSLEFSGNCDDEVDLYWPLYLECTKKFDSSESSDTVARSILDSVKHYIRNDIAENAITDLIAQIDAARQNKIDWQFSDWKNISSVKSYYTTVAWQFTIYLYSHKGIGKIRSRFIANRLLEYWLDRPDGVKIKGRFKLDEGMVEKYIIKNYKSVYCVEGILGAALLEALFYFTDFLKYHSQMAELPTEEIRTLCICVYKRLLRAVDVTDAIKRIEPQFVKNVCLQ